MKIALVQQHATHDIKDNLDRGTAAFREAAENGAELIAFAELSFLRFFPQCRRAENNVPPSETIPGPTTEKFCRLAGEYGIVTIINLYEESDAGTFDASPVIDADGSLLGVSRMVHVFDAPGFHEQDYYTPGDKGATVFATACGQIGVAICYDRHFPEYMRALGVKGADLVVIPQAGAAEEWPDGLFEAELRVASMQNGYYCALANRVGEEEVVTFVGGSFVTDPCGQIAARSPEGEDHILYADLDFGLLEKSPARRHFLKDRRPEVYPL
jgi:N-carbamoylputrescine amidase